jgi:hypothetical protein
MIKVGDDVYWTKVTQRAHGYEFSRREGQVMELSPNGRRATIKLRNGRLWDMDVVRLNVDQRDQAKG